jgi:phage terminase large subunit-like protein
VPFVRGPGAGSIISFATYAQGPSRVAGPPYDIVVLDEPPEEAMWEEVMPRVFQRGGIVRFGFTPTLQMADVSYLERLSQERDSAGAKVLELHMHELNAENVWPVWPTRRISPLKTQAQIDAFESTLPAMTRDMRMGRSWRPMIAGRWLSAFGDDAIRDDLPPSGADLVVSTDHGANAGKQVSMLIAIVGRFSAHPRVWWLDECGSDGTTSPDQDAREILEMLRRNRIGYEQIDHWVGDRPTGRDRWGSGKSNRDLQSAIARELGERFSKTKPIETVEKWDGSVEYGVHVLNAIFARKHGIVRPRCKRFIAGCQTWRGDRRDPVKDALDAGRYGVQHFCDERVFESFRGIY